MKFPIFPFVPRSATSIPIEVQRLGADSPIRHIPPHGHLFFEVLLVTSGSGIVMLNGTSHVAGPGSVFVVAPGAPHDVRSLGAATGWVLLFTSDGVTKEAAPRLTLLDDVPTGLVFDLFRRGPTAARQPLTLTSPDMAALVSLLERIETELSERAPGYEVAVRAALHLIMVHIGRRAGRDVGATVDPDSRGRALLSRVFHDIDEYYVTDPSLASAARRLGLTPAHLTTKVRRLTGRPYGEWVIERRMIEARHRLITTALTLTAIAGALGYSDTESFIRRFRAHHGVTPARWREQARPGAQAVAMPRHA